LKIETQPRDDHQVKILVELESENLESAKRKAARKLSQKAKIPGFRPGKAPYDVIRRFFGESAIEQEAIELLVDEVYPEALTQAEIEPGGPGTLDEIIKTDPPNFSFIVPLAPTVDLGDYQSIRMPYELAPLPEKAVDDFMKDLQRTYATYEPVNRPAQAGDRVFMQMNANILNPAEGESGELLKERSHQADVPADEKEAEEHEWPFPGFSRHLVGLTEGETRSIRYPFPTDSNYESLRGKEVEFNIKVNSVKTAKLPELNDEFAQSVGEFETYEALRSSVQSHLAQQAQEEYDEKFYNELIEKILSQAKIAYPPQMLDDEIEHTLKRIQDDLAQQRMDLETYLKTRELEREKFIETEVKPVSIKRLERSLLINEIAQKENLEINEEEFNQMFTETLTGLEYLPEFRKSSKKISKERLYNAVATQTATRLMNKNVMDRLKQIATGELVNEDKTTEDKTEKKSAKKSTKKQKPEDGEENKGA
jgi:trigger factor